MLIPDKRFNYPQAFQFGVRPPGELRIDYSHELAISDYDYVLDQGRGDTITDLQGQLSLTATTPLWATDYRGMAGDFTATDANKFDATAAPIVTADGSGTGDFAILVAGYFVRESSQSNVVHQRETSGNFAQTNIVANNGGVAGDVKFYTSNVTNTQIIVTDGIPSSGFYVFTGVRTGTTLALYRNGLDIGSTSGTLRDVLSGTQEMAIGGSANSTANPLNGRIHLVRLFNRTVTSGQVYKMSTDIYGHMI